MIFNFFNFFLFFILLVVCLLIISHYGFLGKWEYFSREGFISFQFDKIPLVADIVIPTYSPSSKVYKLYDNLFFDITNGNLIQAIGKPAKQDNKDVVDNEGTSLSSIIVYNRDSTIQSVTINTVLSEDLISNLASLQSKKTGYDVSFSQFIISNLNGTTTDNYQTLYVAWGKRTFIDVINTSSSPPKTLLGALFTDTQLKGRLIPVSLIQADDAKIKIVPSEYIDDANDGRLNTQTWYENKKIFQVSSFLHYDVKNGNIVFKGDNAGDINIFDRQFKMIPIQAGVISGGISTTLPSVEYVVHSVQYNPSTNIQQTDVPKFFIYYVGFGERTILIVLKKQSQTNDMFKIVKVARFDKDGYVVPTLSVKVEPSEPAQCDNTNGDYDVSHNKTHTDRDFFEKDILLAKQIDYIQENYVKKTDMVAPIYPTVLSCPSCSGSNDGVCNNCGGNGGSGTKGAKDNKDTVSNIKDGVVGFGNNIVGGAVDLGKSTLDLGKQAVSGTVDLGKETVGGAVDLTKQGVSGAANMADRAVSGTVDLGKETVGGAVDLTKQAASGAVDLTKQAASGAINQLNYMTTIRGGQGAGTAYGGGGQGAGTAYGGQGAGTAYGGQGAGTAYGGGQRGVPINYNTSGTVSGVDNYSGYGALVNKGDDFMPLTASFSAFGK